MHEQHTSLASWFASAPPLVICYSTLVGKDAMPHCNGALVVVGFASFGLFAQPSRTNAIVGGGCNKEQNRHHHAAAGEGRLDFNTNRVGRLDAMFEGAVADEEKEKLSGDA